MVFIWFEWEIGGGGAPRKTGNRGPLFQQEDLGNRVVFNLCSAPQKTEAARTAFSTGGPWGKSRGQWLKGAKWGCPATPRLQSPEMPRNSIRGMPKERANKIQRFKRIRTIHPLAVLALPSNGSGRGSNGRKQQLDNWDIQRMKVFQTQATNHKVFFPQLFMVRSTPLTVCQDVDCHLAKSKGTPIHREAFDTVGGRNPAPPKNP